MNDDQAPPDISQQLTQINESILKLYQHMEERFDQLEATKADKDQVDRMMVTLDGIAARLDTDEQERAAISSQMDRHDGWIGQLAKHTNTKLIPEQ